VHRIHNAHFIIRHPTYIEGFLFLYALLLLLSLLLLLLLVVLLLFTAIIIVIIIIITVLSYDGNAGRHRKTISLMADHPDHTAKLRS